MIRRPPRSPLFPYPTLFRSETAVARDGTPLRTLHWPAQGRVRAVALIVHGLGEHAGRYDDVAEPLAAAGIDVHGYDHRGNGGSGGRRTWIERWGVLHDDLEDRLRTVREAADGRSVVLYAHSLGGLVALGYMLAEPPRPLPDLLVLSAPGLGDTVASWKRWLAPVVDRILPGLRIANGLPADGLSREIGRAQ